MLDLFSGIGGFSLGLERSGAFETVAFCEIEPYCRAVLKKHWPHVPQYDDVRSLTADRIRSDGISVDAICGGFPCQDISSAGRKAGIEGRLSGLWSEYARLIGEIRPKFAIVENVADLLSRGMDRVLGDLAEIGYGAEWHCIPASAVGAHHRRDRLWIVSYPDEGRKPALPINDETSGLPPFGNVTDANCFAPVGAAIAWQELHPWAAEPELARVANGIPGRMDRVAALGNAVVPQIPELIGRAIAQAEGMT